LLRFITYIFDDSIVETVKPFSYMDYVYIYNMCSSIIRRFHLCFYMYIHVMHYNNNNNNIWIRIWIYWTVRVNRMCPSCVMVTSLCECICYSYVFEDFLYHTYIMYYTNSYCTDNSGTCCTCDINKYIYIYRYIHLI